MYSVEVICDNKDCKSKAFVPEVGAAPEGWIMLAYVKKGLAPSGIEVQQQRVTETYCSWKCTAKKANSQIKSGRAKKESAPAIETAKR